MEYKCYEMLSFGLCFIILTLTSQALCCHWETWENERWADWSECSVTTCKGWGKQERYRINNCQKYMHSKNQEEWYSYSKQMDNQVDMYQERTCLPCYNGGTFFDTHCQCNEGYEGHCCQEGKL